MSILQETRRNFSTPHTPLDYPTVYRNPGICPRLFCLYRQLSQYERGPVKGSHLLKECHKTRLEHSIKERKQKFNTTFFKRYPYPWIKISKLNDLKLFLAILANNLGIDSQNFRQSEGKHNRQKISR